MRTGVRMAPEVRNRCLRNRKPHPCGYYGDQTRECRCTQTHIQTYRNKVSGPLLDRIDIHVEVPAIQFQELASLDGGEPSEAIRTRVVEARRRQWARFGHNGNDGHRGQDDPFRTHCNAAMDSKELQHYCALGDDARDMLRGAMTGLNLSARAYDRILKVSRTIADLERCDHIQPQHVGEAIQYRSLDRQMWA